MSSYEWDSGAIFDLIDLFRERPMLWDCNRDDYRDRSKKVVAWQEIANHFGMDKTVVERKMRILLSQYRRELMRQDGASKWYAFKRLSFLKGAPTANGSSSDAYPQNQSDFEDDKSDEEESYSEDKPQTNLLRAVPSPGSETSSLTQPRPPASVTIRQLPPHPEPTPRKVARKRLQTPESDAVPKKTRCSSYGTNQMIKLLCKERKFRDEFVVYGEYVANKLRNISSCRARNTVQYHINNILFNAEMGKYDSPTRTQDTNAVTCVGSQDGSSRLSEHVDVIPGSSNSRASEIPLEGMSRIQEPHEVQIKMEPPPPHY